MPLFKVGIDANKIEVEFLKSQRFYFWREFETKLTLGGTTRIVEAETPKEATEMVLSDFKNEIREMKYLTDKTTFEVDFVLEDDGSAGFHDGLFEFSLMSDGTED